MIFNDDVRVRVIRAITGMDSKSFADYLKISPNRLTAWEKGRSTPSGKALVSLTALCQDRKIGFTPSGFPFPMADVMMFKPEEK